MTGGGPLHAVLINGPLGIGKSTLGEMLGETVGNSVYIDGDALCTLSPEPPADDFNATVALLVRHRFTQGYRRFFVDHMWERPAQLDDLRRRLAGIDPGLRFDVVLLSLAEAENRTRIERRRAVRAMDETAFEDAQFAHEFALFAAAPEGALGIRFDAAADPANLAEQVIVRFDLALA